MARRRRSLIGGKRTLPRPKEPKAPRPPATSDAPPAAGDADGAPAASGASEAVPFDPPRAGAAGHTLVPDAEALADLEEEVGGDASGDADGAPSGDADADGAPSGDADADGAPLEDPAAWAVDIDIEDGEYVDVGRFEEDSTDHGWQDAVYGSPATVNPEVDDLEAFDAGSGDGTLGGAFIDLAQGDAPPTEEVPSAVMEDLSQIYDAPMSVPEPPPIPGIVDRYTPPQVTRQHPPLPGGTDPGRPAFTPSSAPRARALEARAAAETPPPPVSPPTPPPPDLRRRRFDDDEAIEGADPRALMVAAGIGALVVLTLVLVIWVVVGMVRGPATPPPPARVPGIPAVADPVADPAGEPPRTTTGVPVRERVGGDQDTDVVLPAEGEEEPPPPEPAASTPPPPSPSPPPPAEPPPDFSNGTLSIHSNRQVIVSINGRPVDFTPLELAVPAGTYTISAALPGRADSEQVQEVTLEAGEQKELLFTF